MPNIYQIGRVGQVWLKEEATYGAQPTFAAGDAVRILQVGLNYDPRARVDSPERHLHPSQVERFTRRATADWMLGGIFYPSGTLGTEPDHDLLLKNVFGATTNIPLSTTIASTPTPTTTVFTVAAVTGLVVGQPVLISGEHVRWITSISTLIVTVTPALAAAPASNDTVKGCVGYGLATDVGNSLCVGNYLEDDEYQINGVAPEMLKLVFDANEEVMWESSGPARDRTAVQTKPTAYTTAGTTPPSGLTGRLVWNGAEREFLKAELEIANGLELDNVAFGTDRAQAVYRKGKRSVTLSLETRQSDETNFLDDAESTTDRSLLIQCGETEGSIIAVYAPTIELEVPDDSDSDDERQHTFSGVAKGTSAGNDEVYLAVA